MYIVFSLLFTFSLILLIIGIKKPDKVVFWSNEKTKKKAIIIFGPIVIISLLLFNITDPGKKTSSGEKTPKEIASAQQTNTKKQAAPKSEYKSILDQIEVEVTVQDVMDSKDRNKVVVRLKNKSDYTISGNISVKLKDAAKNTVDSDLVFVDKILAKRGTYAICWLNAKRVINTEYELTLKDAFKEEINQ